VSTPQLSLAGRTALVTGAATGIGRATALLFAQAGARVIVNHLGNPIRAQTLVDEITANSGYAMAIEADVSQAADVQRLLSEATTLGAIDIRRHHPGEALSRHHRSRLGPHDHD
jgi:3-oxoacyl-[acyl-carrier protein] reductase